MAGPKFFMCSYFLILYDDDIRWNGLSTSHPNCIAFVCLVVEQLMGTTETKILILLSLMTTFKGGFLI